MKRMELRPWFASSKDNSCKILIFFINYYYYLWYRQSTFVTDGKDAHRIDYLKRFVTFYQLHHPEAQADGNKYEIMESLIPADEQPVVSVAAD